jgi:hypothetical protein
MDHYLVTMGTTNICRSRRRKRPRVQLEDDEFASTRTAGTKSTQLQLLQQMRHREVRGWHLKSCRRTTTISFTRLQTPTTEAVLGLDDAGDYVFGVHEGVNCLRVGPKGHPLSLRTCGAASTADSAAMSRFWMSEMIWWRRFP